MDQELKFFGSYCSSGTQRNMLLALPGFIPAIGRGKLTLNQEDSPSRIFPSSLSLLANILCTSNVAVNTVVLKDFVKCTMQ